MRALILLFISLFLTNPGVINAQETSSTSKANLLFVVSSSSYDDWYNNAFSADSERRAKYADESRTQVVKLNDKQAVVMLYDFDMSRMPEFAGAPEMIALSEQYEVKHEVYQFKPIADIAPEDLPATSDLGFIITTDNYYDWLTEAFNADANRRAQFCAEDKTKVAKINNEQAFVMLHGFDMQRFGEFAMDPKMVELSEKYNVQHEVFVLTAM